MVVRYVVELVVGDQSSLHVFLEVVRALNLVLFELVRLLFELVISGSQQNY